jgi:hypothetical protein
VITN